MFKAPQVLPDSTTGLAGALVEELAVAEIPSAWVSTFPPSLPRLPPVLMFLLPLPCFPSRERND